MCSCHDVLLHHRPKAMGPSDDELKLFLFEKKRKIKTHIDTLLNLRGRLRQQGILSLVQIIKTSLGDTVRPCLKKRKRKRKKQTWA
jgi:hypothetical protein